MKTPPYNTGKVQIGIYYEPPRRNHMTPEAERLQSALLEPAPRFYDAHQAEVRMAVRDALMLVVGVDVFAALVYSPSLFKLF